MQPLLNKTAIVTGAGQTKGIGRAIALKLAEQGANLVITDLPTATVGLNELKDELEALGVWGLAIAVDVTRPQQVADCMAQTLERFGSIDILVNNAGIGGGSSNFLELSANDFERAYQINLLGAVHCSQAAIPAMCEQGGGAIINTASLCGLGAIPSIPVSYTASKFALVGLTKAIALEFAENNIRCNAVCPGAINTQMRDRLFERIAEEEGISPDQARQNEDATIAIGRGAEPEEVADAVAYLAGPAASYITGVALPVAGGMAPGV